MNRTLIGAALGLLSLSAVAQGGGAAENFNRVQLRAEANAQVENDLMIATLAAEQEAESPARAAAAVNEAMKWALEQARAAAGVRFQTEGYQTFPVHDPSGQVRRWRAQQLLRLESGDSAGLATLVGNLQGRLNVRGMEFVVSPERRRESENGLIERALTGFRERAEIIRRGLGASGYRIVRIDVATGPAETPVRPMAMRSMAAEAVPAPGVAGGRSELRVTASGEIELIGAPDFPRAGEGR